MWKYNPHGAFIVNKEKFLKGSSDKIVEIRPHSS